MDTKTHKTPISNQNNTVRNPSFPDKANPVFIQPIYSKPLYFTVTSNVNESFIVDWQLDDK